MKNESMADTMKHTDDTNMQSKKLSGNSENRRIVDLFSGLGGMRIPFENLGYTNVFSSDWNKEAQAIYLKNFGESPFGDITEIPAEDIPDHEILLGGFPCQAFSIMGDRKGFGDTRGTLFFEIARIISTKNPQAILLENVKQLVRHDGGKTIDMILTVLNQLGYSTHWQVINSLDFGLPHKRERVFIVGFQGTNNDFKFPRFQGTPKELKDILETDVPEKYFASEMIRNRRKAAHHSDIKPSIWHENKSGNISSHPYSCALRTGASHNYLLVDGERHLTPREQLRLLGFPEEYRPLDSDGAMKRLTGNSVCVPIVEAIAQEIDKYITDKTPITDKRPNSYYHQMTLSGL